MTNQHFNYTKEPLESLIFTLSEDSGHRNICSAYPQERERFSVKDKILNDSQEFEFLHRNTSCVVLLHCRPNRGLTKENTQLEIISPIWYLKYPIGNILSNWELVICSMSLRQPAKYIPNPRLDMLSQILYIFSPIGDMRSPIGDNIPNWGYFLLDL